MVDTVLETSGHLIIKSNHIPAACFATRPGGEMEDGLAEGKEGGSEAGRRKRDRERSKRGREYEGGREGMRKRGRAEEEMVDPSNEAEE